MRVPFFMVRYWSVADGSVRDYVWSDEMPEVLARMCQYLVDTKGPAEVRSFGPRRAQ